MNSPLSNSERHSDSNRRDEELRLDKDDVFKSYSERDPRLMQSKKGTVHFLCMNNLINYSILYD